MKKQNSMQNFEQLLHSEDAEKYVISVLLTESTAINEVNTILSPEKFYNPKLSIIYSAILAVSQKVNRIDLISVMAELMILGKLEDVGGSFELGNLLSYSGSSVKLLEHSMYLHQLYLSRKLAIAGKVITANALSPQFDIDDVISESIKQIETISNEMVYDSNTSDLSTCARESIQLYQEREKCARSGLKTGIPTGLDKLDRSTGGFKPAQLIILAARPAMGKTALMLMMAKAAAISNTPVLLLTLEMSSTALSDRMIISESDFKADRYRNGYLSDDEKPALCDAVNYLSTLPITIDETASISMQQIKALAKNLQRKGKCGMLLIDYLQLINMRSANKTYNREQEVAACSREAKMIAKELNIPVVLLSQLSRKNEERADKTPILSDLRESGAIEQDADLVLFIHRPEYYDSTAEKGKGVLRIAKQRNGITGDIYFGYNDSLTRFFDYVK